MQYEKEWKEKERQEILKLEKENPKWQEELLGSFIAVPPKESDRKDSKDNSMRTAYILMAVCGLGGLVANGFAGLLVGVGVGFAITSLVYISKEGAKHL